MYNVHDQACSHVFRFGAQNTFSGVENFCFYNVFKTNLFGHKKTWGSLLPNATVTTGLYMTTQQFLMLFGGGWAKLMCPLPTSMFMANSMLLWWTSSRVPLPLVIKPKVVKEAPRLRKSAGASGKLRQSNRTDKLIELTIQFTLVERNFRSKNDWLGEDC